MALALQVTRAVLAVLVVQMLRLTEAQEEAVVVLPPSADLQLVVQDPVVYLL